MKKPSVPTIHVEYAGDDQRKKLVFANGDSELLLVTQVASDQFRLDESSFVSDMEVHYHDVIRASIQADGSLEFHEVVSKSGLCTTSWLLPKPIIESRDFRAVLDAVINLGGNWERAFGGFLLIHVPPGHATAINERIKALIPPAD